ncbi:hypothetical protein [Rathayibacter sp. PhB151]|uniref:hypothetical protein n=1 Tax=Rathayibacter sp. PhB151 TaxID=2485189 RepID=UPI0010636D95|nr:hypothetical protein [Rathayibacter sp. PhB151]
MRGLVDLHGCPLRGLLDQHASALGGRMRACSLHAGRVAAAGGVSRPTVLSGVVCRPAFRRGWISISPLRGYSISMDPRCARCSISMDPRCAGYSISMDPRCAGYSISMDPRCARCSISMDLRCAGCSISRHPPFLVV